MSADALNTKYLDSVTDELRAAGWYPRGHYLCGCTPPPGRLCAEHADRRAADHYHPEATR